MKIHYNKDFECYMVAECHKTNVIELDGAKLIPITELEKIKDRLEIAMWYNRRDKEYCIDLIDKRISELKGEAE